MAVSLDFFPLGFEPVLAVKLSIEPQGTVPEGGPDGNKPQLLRGQRPGNNSGGRSTLLRLPTPNFIGFAEAFSTRVLGWYLPSPKCRFKALKSASHLRRLHTTRRAVGFSILASQAMHLEL